MKRTSPLTAVLSLHLIVALSLINGCGFGENNKKLSVSSPPNGSLLEKQLPPTELPAWYRGKITSINLGNYRGQWLILFFYPGDFTFVCPTELKELADYYKEIKRMGGEVVSISTDSAWVHRAWHRHDTRIKSITYPMLSDRNGKLARALGVYNSKKGSAQRGTFIVNPDGRIMACEIHHDAIGRSADELLRKLSAAIAVRGAGGSYCPAGWKEGDKMIHEK